MHASKTPIPIARKCMQVKHPYMLPENAPIAVALNFLFVDMQKVGSA